MAMAWAGAVWGHVGIAVASGYTVAVALALHIVAPAVYGRAGTLAPANVRHQDGGVYSGEWRAQAKHGVGVYRCDAGAALQRPRPLTPRWSEPVVGHQLRPHTDVCSPWRRRRSLFRPGGSGYRVAGNSGCGPQIPQWCAVRGQVGPRRQARCRRVHVRRRGHVRGRVSWRRAPRRRRAVVATWHRQGATPFACGGSRRRARPPVLWPLDRDLGDRGKESS